MSGPDSFAEAVRSDPRIHQDVVAPDGTEATLVYRDASLNAVFAMGQEYDDDTEAARDILDEYWIGEYDAETEQVEEISVEHLEGLAWLNCVVEGFLEGLGMNTSAIDQALEGLQAELDEADEGNG